MEILELKNAITKIKNLMNGLNSRMERTKERIRELKGKTIEITHQNNREESLRKKMNSISDTYNKDLTSMSL